MVLDESDHVDLNHIAEVLHVDTKTVVVELGDAIFRDAQSGSWQTDGAYLSSQVCDKLMAA